MPAQSVPEGWCVYAYGVYVFKRGLSNASGPQEENLLRTVFISRTHKNNINNSIAKANYLTLYHDADESTNSLHTFENNISWNPNICNSYYGIIWITVVNSITVVTGARCLIRRV